RNPALATACGLAVVAALTAVVVSVSFGIYQNQAAEDLRTALSQVKAQERLARQTANDLQEEQKKTKTALRDAKTEGERAATRLAENYLDRALMAGDRDGDAALALHWITRALENVPAGNVDLQSLIRTQWAGWKTEVSPLKGIF